MTHYAMKTYARLDVEIHVFLTLIDERDGSTLRLGLFAPGKVPSVKVKVKLSP
jgi:hypothetical protein